MSESPPVRPGSAGPGQAASADRGGAPREPGEVLPPASHGSRTLERPPAARYRSEASPQTPAEPRRVAALLAGAMVALLVALVMALLRSVLDLGAGLLVVAALGGWAVGVTVQRVAWGGHAHEGSMRGALVAGASAVLAWAMWLVLSWMVAQAVLVGSSRTFLERLRATPLPDYLAPQFGLYEVAVLGLLVASAAYGGRDR